MNNIIVVAAAIALYGMVSTANGQTLVESGKTLNSTLGSRILFGDLAKINEFPWMATIRYFFGLVTCGGAILDAKHILTSAHCFDHLKNRLSLVSVQVGEYDYEDPMASEQYSIIERVYIHESYIPCDLSTPDIAVIKLKEKIQFKFIEGVPGAIKPIKLPRLDSRNEFGKKLAVSGFGMTETEIQSMKLKKFYIDEVIECPPAARGNTITCPHTAINREYYFCDAFKGNQPSISDGDSGSGAVLFGKSNEPELVGLVLGTINQSIMVYTRVSPFVNWINEKRNLRE